MAKKRKSTRKKSAPAKQSPQHNLPDGFWSQIGAVLLVALALIYIVSWTKAGGPVLDQFYVWTVDIIGFAVYVLPLAFIFIAVEIFRSEENKVPLVTKMAVASVIFWFSALFGLLKLSSGQATGGYLGSLINNFASMFINGGIAAFVYILLIVLTVLFILKISPFTVIKKVWELVRRDRDEDAANIKVLRKVAAVDAGENTDVIGNFKLSANVPTIDENDKKKSRLAGLSGGLSGEKAPEERSSALVTASDPNWKAPGLDLLEKKQSPADAGDVNHTAMVIKKTMQEFDIDVEMEGANIGPRVTQFIMKPSSGIKLARITALETNLALNLAAKSLRIEAPIPGRSAVGIEVPNRKAADVRLHSILSSPQWINKTEPLTFAVGKDISGNAVVAELNDMPHLLIAGQTKAGKSVMINTLLTSLLYHNSPSDMKLVLIDPKRVEMTAYEDIPHLLTPIITEVDKTISALKWSVQEMERRYALMQEHKVKSIGDYNKAINSKGHKISVTDENGHPQDHEDGAMPYIVIVIDELSDLKSAASKDFEGLIIRLAQKGRAAGIHLVLATQSPRKDVITGLIKANVPAKIAFAVSNQLESRIILDDKGADKLLGNGDMLLSIPSEGQVRRVQGAWVTDGEVHRVMDYLRMQSPPQYNDEVTAQPVQLNGKGGVVMDFDGGNDGKFKEAVQLVIDSGRASTTLLQTRLSIGYARAARIMTEMEDQGVIGPANGARPREVLIDSFDELDGGVVEDDEI